MSIESQKVIKKEADYKNMNKIIESSVVNCTLNKNKRVDCLFQSIDGEPNTFLRDVENIEVQSPFYFKRDKNNKEIFFSANPGGNKLSCAVWTGGKKSNIRCHQIKGKKNKSDKNIV